MKRNATANWKGGKEGKGILTTQSMVLKDTAYSFNSRFADGVGTNPEELIAAAHAGCFSMKLAIVLGEAGYTPDSLTTTCTITIADGVITGSDLVLKARVPGIQKAKFEECVADAKANCPVSKLLKTAITMDASLI